MDRRQRGHVARPSTRRPGSLATQSPHAAHFEAGRPGGRATPAPHDGQAASGASTKRTRWPQAGQAARSPWTRMAAPHAGHGVVAAGTRRELAVPA